MAGVTFTHLGMTARDKTFQRGRIGVGSFDDTGDWDDIRLRGVKVESADG